MSQAKANNLAKVSRTARTEGSKFPRRPSWQGRNVHKGKTTFSFPTGSFRCTNNCRRVFEGLKSVGTLNPPKVLFGSSKSFCHLGRTFINAYIVNLLQVQFVYYSDMPLKYSYQFHTLHSTIWPSPVGL